MILSRLARLGYASAGAVYIIIGVLTIAAGLGEREAGSTSSDAFRVILDKPFGRVMLGVMVLGLLGYAVWRFVAGVTDKENDGSDAKGVGARLFSIARGLVYATFAVEAIRLMTRGGSGGSGGDQQARHWTRRLLEMPLGTVLVAVAGIGVVLYGAYQLYAAWDAKLSKRLHLGRIDDRIRRKVIAVSRFGIGARGIVFFIAGGSLVIAALRHDAGAAHGTSGSIALLPQPMLLVVGAGLIAYGIYAFVNARYREIRT